jgi:Ca-activated chloride channel family protein
MRADFSLDYDVLTVERPQKLYLMARFEAGEGPNDALRRPLNLSLVIDRSGSMAGDKIDYTKQAAQFLVQHLGANDIFSIVLYNDKVETLVPPERLSNKDAVVQMLESMRVRGTTNLSGGWLEGCQHVSSQLSAQTLNRVILMSDGLANRGVTDAPTLVGMAKQKREEGVTTTTMGLGKDFNEDLMMEMAHSGGGAFYFIESPEVTPEIFKEELSGLLSVVGQNLTISIEPNQHVSSIRQLNAYSVSTDGKKTSFQLGDIFAHEVKTLVLELSIPAMDSLGETQIAVLRFEYDEISESGTKRQTKSFDVMVNVKAPAEFDVLPNPDVAQSVLLLKAAQARQEAVKAADHGDYTHASQVLRDMAKTIVESQVMSIQLKEEKDALIEQADRMDKGAAAYNEYSRKTMSTQAFYTMTSRHDDTVMLRLREQQREQSDNVKATLEKEISAVQEEDGPTVVPKEEGVPPTHMQWKGQSFELKGDIIRLGRSSHNEIVIDEKGVSRFHGQIRRMNGKYFFEDLGSTNGTTVDGKQIKQPYELSIGDVVFLCDEKLVFTKPKS